MSYQQYSTPAFPYNRAQSINHSWVEGMLLRDYFAAIMMPYCVENQGLSGVDRAYEIADEALRVREK
jgi:hypothetical protein